MVGSSRDGLVLFVIPAFPGMTGGNDDGMTAVGTGRDLSLRIRSKTREMCRGGPPWPPVSKMPISVVVFRQDRRRGPGQARGPVPTVNNSMIGEPSLLEASSTTPMNGASRPVGPERCFPAPPSTGPRQAPDAPPLSRSGRPGAEKHEKTTISPRGYIHFTINGVYFTYRYNLPARICRIYCTRGETLRTAIRYIWP